MEQRRTSKVATHVRYDLLLTTLLLFSSACGHDSSADVDGAAEANPTGDAGECNADSDCSRGFCDASGACAPIDENNHFGTDCEPEPEPMNNLLDGKFNTCGAYLCIDGRCRSCSSDEQCQEQRGAPMCGQLEGRPGYRCGNYR